MGSADRDRFGHRSLNTYITFGRALQQDFAHRVNDPQTSLPDPDLPGRRVLGLLGAIEALLLLGLGVEIVIYADLGKGRAAPPNFEA